MLQAPVLMPPGNDSRLDKVCDQRVAAQDVEHLATYPGLKIVRHLQGYDQSNHTLSPQWGERVAIYHPLLAKLIFMGEEEWSVFDRLDGQIQPSRELSEDAINHLLKSGVLIDKRHPWQVTIAPQFDEADMYIKTTEGCNFSCKGCVTASDIIHPSKARTLDVETTKLLLESFVRSGIEKNMKRVNFKWAGGEPLLSNAFKVIQGCADFVQELRARYPEILITQSILSNGVYASKEKADFLREHHIHISVSLWGTPDYQDKMRLPRNKIESFQRIADQLRYMHESGMSYSTSFVVTPENAHDYADFITMIWDVEHPTFIGREWKNPRPLEFDIGLYRPQHGQVYQPGDTDTMEQGLRAGFERVRGMLERGIPVPYMDRFDYLDLFNTILVPCGSGYNYVAVGPEGASACHEGLFGMNPNMDRIRNGENVFDIVNEEYVPHRPQLLGTNMMFEQEGEVLAFHGGQGCPRLAKSEHGGSYGNASTGMAKVYAAIYPELLSLEMMRRRKINSIVS